VPLLSAATRKKSAKNCGNFPQITIEFYIIIKIRLLEVCADSSHEGAPSGDLERRLFLMQPNESYGASQPDDDALVKKILLSQTEVDREAMVRFYVKCQTAEWIEEALGLDAGHVGRLKRLIRTRFLKERCES
jgi:hypothetical protein